MVEGLQKKVLSEIGLYYGDVAMPKGFEIDRNILQSDILNIKIEQPTNIESTALGVGILAGLGIGFWDDIGDIIRKSKTNRLFTPEMSEKRRSHLNHHWERAISQSQKY